MRGHLLNYSLSWASNFCGSLSVAGCWKRFLDDEIPLVDCGTVQKPMCSSIKILPHQPNYAMLHYWGKKSQYLVCFLEILQANKGNKWFDQRDNFWLSN